VTAPDQRALELIASLCEPVGEDVMGRWYVLVPNDPDELGQSPSPFGVKIKLGGRPGEWLILDVTTYNR
jgi:hypothetical protein